MKRLLFGSAVIALLTALLTVRASGPPAAQQPPRDWEAWDFVFLGQSRPVLIRMHVLVDGHQLEAVWGNFIDAVFKYLDTNGDGVLSAEELAGMPPPSSFFGGGGGGGGLRVRLAPVAGRIPAKASPAAAKTMSRAELAEHFRKQGAGPLQLRLGNDRQNIYTRLVFAGQVQAPSAEEANRLLFEALDTNHDGKLSREELAAGEALLRKRDANDDEMLTPEELTPNNLPESGDDGVFAVAYTIDGMGDGGNMPLVAVRKGSDPDLARRLLAHYAPKPKAGPAAKKLRQEDLRLDAATFAALDADKDGTLDAEELARFGNRTPDVELEVGIVLNGGGPKVAPVVKVLHAESSPVSKSLHVGKEGKFALDLGTTRLTMDAPTVGGPTASFVVNSRQQYLQEFKRADRDGNGYLDAEEAKRSPLFSGLFKFIDRDGDGKVFEREVIAYLERMEDLQNRAAKSYAALGMQSQASGLFDMLDTNHDGRLSVREMRQLPKLLAKLDRNGDGFINAEEVPKTYQLTLGPGGRGNQYVGNGVVFVDSSMQSRAPAPAPAAGPLWFRKMDRNRDGDVSRREFLGTDEEFRKIDTDGDGLISLEEAIRAEKLFRKSKPGK